MHEIFFALLVNKLEFACRIFNHLPEAFPLDLLTCQSSSGKRKSTRYCGFMFFINSKASLGTNIFFTSVFGTKKCVIGVPRSLWPLKDFVFRSLCSNSPFLPLPIMQKRHISSIKIFYFKIMASFLVILQARVADTRERYCSRSS